MVRDTLDLIERLIVPTKQPALSETCKPAKVRVKSQGNPFTGERDVKHRLFLPIIFAVLVPSPVVSQSDWTCIAYMEADEIYEVAMRAEAVVKASVVKAAREANRDIADAIEIAAEATRRREAAAAVIEGSRSGPTAAEAAHRFVTAIRGETQAINAMIADFGQAATELYELQDELAAATENTAYAREARSRKYWDAYQGPTSRVDAIMTDLIRRDREACRKRFR